MAKGKKQPKKVVIDERLYNLLQERSGLLDEIFPATDDEARITPHVFKAFAATQKAWVKNGCDTLYPEPYEPPKEKK